MMLRVRQVNAPNHLNLNMHFNGEDELTDVHKAFTGIGLSLYLLLHWAHGNLSDGATRFSGLNTSVQFRPKPKPAKVLTLHSAQPQKTLTRWSTSQSLKRDSFPQEKPTDLQLSGAVGRPHFQACKTQAILASSGWAPVAVLPHCKFTKTRTQLPRTSPVRLG